MNAFSINYDSANNYSMTVRLHVHWQMLTGNEERGREGGRGREKEGGRGRERRERKREKEIGKYNTSFTKRKMRREGYKI